MTSFRALRLRPFALALVGIALVAESALASGGSAFPKHDNDGSDGWCTLFANGQDMNRWSIRYTAHELDPKKPTLVRMHVLSFLDDVLARAGDRSDQLRA